MTPAGPALPTTMSSDRAHQSHDLFDADNWVFSELWKALPHAAGLRWWRTRSGAEVDFVVCEQGRIVEPELDRTAVDLLGAARARPLEALAVCTPRMGRLIDVLRRTGGSLEHVMGLELSQAGDMSSAIRLTRLQTLLWQLREHCDALLIGAVLERLSRAYLARIRGGTSVGAALFRLSLGDLPALAQPRAGVDPRAALRIPAWLGHDPGSPIVSWDRWFAGFRGESVHDRVGVGGAACPRCWTST